MPTKNYITRTPVHLHGTVVALTTAAAWRTLLSGALLVLSTSCSPDTDDTTGKYVDYYVEDGFQACGHTPAFLDNFVPFLASELGLEIKGRIDYYWVNAADFDAACPPGAVGCQLGDQVYARNPALLHELVHAVTEAGAMNNLPFFTEGIAVAYDPWPGEGIGPRFLFKPDPGDPELDPRGFMTLESHEFKYGHAGSFVSFLLLRHGPEKMVALTRGLTRDVDYPRISQIFGQVYGVSLDDEAEVFIANNYCNDSSGTVKLYDCAGPDVEWGTAGWSWSPTMDCAGGDVAGGLGEAGMRPRSRSSVALEVPTAGQYELAVRSSSDETVTATLGRCFGCPWSPKDIVARKPETRTVELAAGRHFLRVTAAADQTTDVEVSVTPL